jgi:hypothetical protein
MSRLNHQLREFKAKPVVGVAVRTINERVLHILHGNMNDALSNFLFAVLLIVIAGRMLLQLRNQRKVTPVGE